MKHRLCELCGISKEVYEFYQNSNYRDGCLPWCKSCRKKYQRRHYHKKSIRQKFLQSSRNNAKKKGLVHTIKMEDIPLPLPRFCKYLGVKLDYSSMRDYGRARHPYIPTIDRIDSSLGYIPGNIQIISDMANTMKSNASVNELLAFAKGVLRIHGDFGQDGRRQRK